MFMRLSFKEEAKNVIESLPNEATMEEIIHALYIHATFEKGEREIREGKGVDDQTARKRLRRWSI
jgi:hypothetical protein